MIYYTHEQKKVISHENGHMLVRAVPGSGKTKTLVGRICYLINKKKIAPQDILVLMFNRDARDSFSKKLSEKRFNIPHNKKVIPNNVRVCTFHSFALEELKKASKYGYLNIFKGEADEDKEIRKHLLRDTLREYAQKERKEYDEYKLTEEFIDKVRNLKAECYNPYIETTEEQELFERAYKGFEEKRLAHNIRTEEDWIPDLVNTLYSTDLSLPRYQYILVDEYQDINIGQNRLLTSLCQTGGVINAVGDEDQCIYSWRGSRPDLMSDEVFLRTFPGSSFYKLTTTFRFGHSLSLVANSVINNNQKREKKICISHLSTPDTKVKLIESNKPSISLITLIQTMKNKNIPLSDISVLTRNNAQLLLIQFLMRLFCIPYKGKTKHDDSSQDVFCTIGLLMHFLMHKKLCPERVRNDNFISRFLRGMSPFLKISDAKKIAKEIAKDDTINLCIVLEQAARELNKKDLSELSKIMKELHNIEIKQKEISAFSIFDHMVRTADLFSLWDKKSNSTIDSNHRVRTLSLFGQVLSDNNIAPNVFISQLISPLPIEDENSVSLMTCHRSKGLEFPYVIMADLYDEQFPSGNFDISNDNPLEKLGLEEERRLFYVGMTRAIKALFLLSPEDSRLSRWLANPKTFSHPNQGEILASRFIYESDIQKLVQYGRQLHDSGAVTLQHGKDWLVKKYLREYRALSKPLSR
ncbi:ATP-dependent helicase [Endozoicomonas sp. ALD040]|uniref:ATP-dependent helicase n=1 Tax=Endozoicomonas sp. ALD040 TaxID=3403079 RepID=UPI003BAFD936